MTSSRANKARPCLALLRGNLLACDSLVVGRRLLNGRLGIGDLGNLLRRDVEGAADTAVAEVRRALTFGGLVIAARKIMDGAVVVAVRGAIGAGEIFDPISEIGVGIAQALRIASVAERAR